MRIIILVFLIFILIALLLAGTTTILWTYSDWNSEGMPVFTILRIECLVVTGVSALLDRRGQKIVGKFFTVRVIVLGLGTGFDYLLEKANEDSK